MLIIRINLFEGCWTEDNLPPHRWDNRRRYNNYLSTVKMDSEGEFESKYCPQSIEQDLYYNVSHVHIEDILKAGCWDECKHRQINRYYVVIDKNEEELIMCLGTDDEEFTTYRMAVKFREKLREHRKIRGEKVFTNGECE